MTPVADPATLIPAPGEAIPPESAKVPGKAGRPAGRENNLTRERREFVNMIVGAEDSEDRKLFAASLRKQFMDGTISPAIGTLILQWWLGKPRENVSFEARIQKVVRHIVDPVASTETPVDAQVVSRG